MLRSFILIWFSLQTWVLLAQAPQPPIAQPGGRIAIPDTGFSIVPPPGWEVLRNSHGSSLLFKAPKQGGAIRYEPTIQVLVFNGYRYIDDLTQQEYGKLIVEKFSLLSNQVHNYRNRSEEKIKLESGDEAILYYTEFNYDDIPIMQMHILVSSATHHFLMTYTDLAQAFESENSTALGTAYSSMHAALLDSKPPSRFQALMIGGPIAAVLIILWFGSRIIRSRRLTALAARIEDEESREIQADEETEYYSRHQPLSEVDADAAVDTRESSLKPMPQSRPAELQRAPGDHRKSTREIPIAEQRRTQPPLPPALQPPPSSHAPGGVQTSPKNIPQAPRSLPGSPVTASKHHSKSEVSLPPRSHHTVSTAEAVALPQKKGSHSPVSSTQSMAGGRSPVPTHAGDPRGNPLANGDEDLSEEARLSQILPQAGAFEEKRSKKKRNLFWKKEQQEDEDGKTEEGSSDAWKVEARTKPDPDDSAGESQTVSQAWALDAEAKDDGEAPAISASSSVWALNPAKESEQVAAEKSKGKGKSSSVSSIASAAANRGKHKAKTKAKSDDDEAEEQDEGDWNLAAKISEEDEEEVG